MTQDPALFEDAPAIRAAVIAERRFGQVEVAQAQNGAKLDAIASGVQGIVARLDVQNGRIAKGELAIEELRDAQVSALQRERDRRLYERLDILEADKADRAVQAAHDDGVRAGTVALRTSDKAWFGLFVSVALALATIAVKFL